MKQMRIKRKNNTRFTMYKSSPEEFDNYARTILKVMLEAAKNNGKCIDIKTTFAWEIVVKEDTKNGNVVASLYGNYVGLLASGSQGSKRDIVMQFTLPEKIFSQLGSSLVDIDKDDIKVMWYHLYKLVCLLNNVGVEPETLTIRLENNAGYDDVQVSILI